MILPRYVILPRHAAGAKGGKIKLKKASSLRHNDRGLCAKTNVCHLLLGAERGRLNTRMSLG